MKVESNTTGVRRSAAPSLSPNARADRVTSDWVSTPTAVEVLSRLPGLSDRFVAAAPGRLDVMGGLAEYSGSSIGNMPAGGIVFVGVEAIEAEDVSILSVGSPNPADSSNEPSVIPLARLRDDQGKPIGPERARKLIDPEKAGDAWCVLATLLEMIRAGAIPQPQRGLVVSVGSTLGNVSCAAEETALSAATAVALAGLYDVALDGNATPAICQRVANEWLDLPIGMGDAFCALLGETGALGELACPSCDTFEKIRIPDGLSILGIDCGVIHPDAVKKFARARTASFMGLGLIERIICHEGSGNSKLNGSLAQVSANDFVGRFRDRLPRKLRGSEYLERFGETEDTLTSIEPDHLYKIRSRTEHHIYEHVRVREFFDWLKRALVSPSTPDEHALTEAGELMYASHWSYGQRCGLGNVETDLLVNLIREHGTGFGVFGAKITGRGCGGVVAVLMEKSDRAREAIDVAIQTFGSQTKSEATLLQSACSGAMRTGARNLGTASRS